MQESYTVNYTQSSILRGYYVPKNNVKQRSSSSFLLTKFDVWEKCD